MNEVYQPLPSGGTLTIRVLEPPLGDDAEQIHYSWRDVRDAVVSGRLADTSLDRFFVAEVDGAFAGSMMYATPRDTRDVAVLEFVWTEPQFRRRGIARALLAYLLDDFRKGGGASMYLCTTNPHAYALYAQQGFRSLVGDGMRYLAPGHEDFDRQYFAYAGPATVRPATWGDLARVSALYNQPEPDWLVKDYHAPRRVFRDMRYESHYIRVWKPASEGRGCVLVLENSARHVVGIASALETDDYYEQHVHLVDCWACPAYLHQLPELLAACAARAEQGGAEVLQGCIAEGDAGKRQSLEEAGFAMEARLRNRFRTGAFGEVTADTGGRDERTDLLVYTRFLDRKPAPLHALDTYYGARRAFHSRAPDPAPSRPASEAEQALGVAGADLGFRPQGEGGVG